jgi:branched-chain amino acid transport system substrate-binding protein
MNRTLRIAALAALASSFFAGAQESRDYFKVGVDLELSGDLGTDGNFAKRGYEMWANAVNEAGGILIGKKKYKVQLAYADNQSVPAQGASAAERLITQEHVDFMFGPYSSGVTIATSPVVEKYKVPMIGGPESPNVWLRKPQYTFGTIPPVNFTGAGTVDTLMALSPKPQSAVVVGLNDPFSKSVATSFKDAFEKRGVKVLKFDIVPPGQDLTPLLSVMKGMEPDIVAYGGHDEDLIKFVKSMHQINFSPKGLIMHYGITGPAFFEALKADANQIFGAAVWTETTKTSSKILWPNSEAFAKAGMKAYGVPVDYDIAGCAAGGIAFQVALQRINAAPPLDEAKREQLMKALEAVDVDTFYGHIKFATEGEFFHSNTAMKILTLQIQNGQAKVVGPPSDMEAKPQYPMVPWDKR